MHVTVGYRPHFPNPPLGFPLNRSRSRGAKEWQSEELSTTHSECHISDEKLHTTLVDILIPRSLPRIKDHELFGMLDEHAPEETRRQQSVERCCAGVFLGAIQGDEGYFGKVRGPILTSPGAKSENSRCFPSTLCPSKDAPRNIAGGIY